MQIQALYNTVYMTLWESQVYRYVPTIVTVLTFYFFEFRPDYFHTEYTHVPRKRICYKIYQDT
jgi:hypothetical protein